MSERLRDGCGRASAGRRRRAPFGRGREREQRGIGTEGEVDVAPGRCVASPGGRGSEQRGRRRWKQEVEFGRARVDTPTSFWRKEEGDWHGPGGPAQPGKWPPGLSLLFLFNSVFYFSAALWLY